MPYQRDTLYDTPQAVVDFRFDERTAAVFPDMIHRSVPGYATLLQLFAVIGAGFVREGGHIYDLGCALGGASIALQRHIPPSATIDAVDNASPMTERLAAYVAGAGINNIRVQQADITVLDYAPADLIIMAFTLQFIPPQAREFEVAAPFAVDVDAVEGERPFAPGLQRTQPRFEIGRGVAARAHGGALQVDACGDGRRQRGDGGEPVGKMAVRRGAGKGSAHRVVLRDQGGFQGEGVLPLGKGGDEVGHGFRRSLPNRRIAGRGSRVRCG